MSAQSFLRSRWGRRLEEIGYQKSLGNLVWEHDFRQQDTRAQKARGEPGALATSTTKSLEARSRGFKSHRPHHFLLFMRVGVNLPREFLFGVE